MYVYKGKFLRIGHSMNVFSLWFRTRTRIVESNSVRKYIYIYILIVTFEVHVRQFTWKLVRMQTSMLSRGRHSVISSMKQRFRIVLQRSLIRFYVIISQVIEVERIKYYSATYGNETCSLVQKSQENIPFNADTSRETFKGCVFIFVERFSNNRDRGVQSRDIRLFS